MSDQTISNDVDEMPRQDRPARVRQRSRYDRPRTYISWVGLVLGLALGVGGGLFYTWNLAPVEEFDTAPWQLRQDDLDQFVVAVMLDYAHDADLARTVSRLVDLRLPGNDPIQSVADTACRLARSGFVDSSSGLRAIRNMMVFYQQQGKSGCADQLIPLDESQSTPVVQVVLPTPTLRPPATKTPTPPAEVAPPTSPPTAPPLAPTSPPRRAFEILSRSSFCDPRFSGTIEVRVLDINGNEIPGQPVRVRWDGGESTFYTGLKPERGPGYADFQMEAGRAYTIEMPRLSDPSSTPLTATECFTEGGQQTITSYRVTFRGG